VTTALLLDLDDTLVVDEAAQQGAFDATAALAARRHPVDAPALARDARTRARELWRGAAVTEPGRRIGMSSGEGLWCAFEGDGDELRALRAWSPGYRRAAWRRALRDHAIDDDELAGDLGERLVAERRARHRAFADAAPALDALRAGRRLALVTNGASCLQREKLAASGLAGRFDEVVVSGDLGLAKPHPAIYERALRALGADPGDAVMVGDSLRNDVDGARAAGLRAIWVNREGRPRPAGDAGLVEIGGLGELPAALREVAR
jgi:phosphoserine phosphatase